MDYNVNLELAAEACSLFIPMFFGFWGLGFGGIQEGGVNISKNAKSVKKIPLWLKKFYRIKRITIPRYALVQYYFSFGSLIVVPVLFVVTLLSNFNTFVCNLVYWGEITFIIIDVIVWMIFYLRATHSR